MASFFNKIDVPDLTQSAQSIETMVQAINDNFQKVFTLPFLKGDPGDEITTRFEYFWDDNNLLTQEAVDIFNTVFEQNIFTVGLNFDEFIQTLTEHQIINDENIEKPYWSDSYGPDKEPKVLLYYKINTEDTTEEKIGVAQLYYFFDPRITLLSKNDLLYNKSFKDYTCILTTEYIIDEDGNYSYKYVKQTGWPTLYYNQTTSQFCWAINGHQTGINAQGVNGKDGIGSKVWLVKLNNKSQGTETNFDVDKKYLENYYTRFSIESVWYPASKKWIAKNEMETTLPKNSGQIFTNDDVFIGYVTGSDPQMEIGLWQYDDKGQLTNTNKTIKDIPIPDMWVGTLHYDETAKENEDKYFVMCNISQNLSVANNNMNLCKMLADIKPSTNNGDPNHLKGLYLRSDANNIHAIFNGGHIDPDNTDLYIAPTELKYMSNSEKIQTISNKNLNIIYNTKINGELNVTNTTTLNNNLIISSNSSINLGLTDYNTPNQCGISYNEDGEKNLCFYGKYDSVSGNQIPIIKSIRYFNSGGFEMANRIRFRNSGTQIYDKLFIGSNDYTIIEKDKLQNGPTLFVYGGAQIISNTALNGGLTVGTENSPKPTTLYGKLTVKSGAEITGDLTVSATNISSGKLTVTSNGVTIFGNILPGNNATYNLGSDSTGKVYKWNNVYANTFNGALIGNASSASTAFKLTLSQNYGSNIKPVYFTTSGVPIECEPYAGGTRLNINGNSYTSSKTIYAPTSSGKSGQILVSNGSGEPIWSSGNVGTDTNPVYMSDGAITKCGRSAGFIYWNTDSLDAWSEGFKFVDIAGNNLSYYPKNYCPHFYINMLNVKQIKCFEFPSDLYQGNVMITLRLANASDNNTCLFPYNGGYKYINSGVYHIYFDNKETTVKVNDVDKTFRNIFEVVQIA